MDLLLKPRNVTIYFDFEGKLRALWWIWEGERKSTSHETRKREVIGWFACLNSQRLGEGRGGCAFEEIRNIPFIFKVSTDELVLCNYFEITINSVSRL